MTTMDKVGNNLEYIALETLIPYAGTAERTQTRKSRK